MTEDDVLSEFRSCDALLEGHFKLSSGRHSAYYLQCARVLMNPERAGRLALAIAQRIPREIRSAIDVVVSPAMGGLIIGHEMGRALSKDAIFLERPTGTFELRRGFALAPGARVLMGPSSALGSKAEPVSANITASPVSGSAQTPARSP